MWHHPHQPSPSDPSHCHQLTIFIALSTAGHHSSLAHHPHCQQSIIVAWFTIPIVSRALCGTIPIRPISLSTEIQHLLSRACHPHCQQSSLSAEHVRPISFSAEHVTLSTDNLHCQQRFSIFIVSRACHPHLILSSPLSTEHQSGEHVRPISVPVWQFLAEHQSSSAHLIVIRACQTLDQDMLL